MIAITIILFNLISYPNDHAKPLLVNLDHPVNRRWTYNYDQEKIKLYRELYREIFVYILCLIITSISVFDQATEYMLNIERKWHE